MNRNVIVVVGVVVYALFILGIGLVKRSNGKQFANAGGSISAFSLVCSMFISIFSGLFFFGTPAAFFREGAGVAAGTGGCVAAFMSALCGYRLWLLGRKYGYLTPSDYLRDRYYSKGYGLFVALILVIFIVPYAALQLVAIGNGINLGTGGLVPYKVAVVAAIVCITVQLFSGGMKSVAWLDVFHLFLGVGALMVFSVYLLLTYFPDGGLAEAVSQLIAEPRDEARLFFPGPNGYFDWKGTLDYTLAGAVATFVWPHIFMRCYLAKDTTNFRSLPKYMPIIYTVAFVFIGMIGMVLAPAILGSDYPDSDNIVPVLASQYSPGIITLFVTLCIFAFAESTTSSMLMSCSTIVSRDLYLFPKYSSRGLEPDEHKGAVFSRIVLIMLMIAMIFIAVSKPVYIVDFAYKLSSPFFAMILPATIGGLFWKRGTKQGAWAGTVAGMIIVTLCTFFISAPWGLSAITFGLAVNLILYVGVSLCTKAPEEVLEKYYYPVQRYCAVAEPEGRKMEG